MHQVAVGVGVNRVEFDALNEDFSTRGRRQAEQVVLMRRLRTEDVFSFQGEFHRFEDACILPRPSETIPVLFGGSSQAALERCARLGDGWIPLGSPNEKSERRVAELRRLRDGAGLAWDGFRVYAQAQFAGGTPERWQSHAEKWQALGATHLAVATHKRVSGQVASLLFIPLTSPRIYGGPSRQARQSLATATHNDGPTDVDGHLARIAEYRRAVRLA